MVRDDDGGTFSEVLRGRSFLFLYVPKTLVILYLLFITEGKF